MIDCLETLRVKCCRAKLCEELELEARPQIKHKGNAAFGGKCGL